MKKKSVYGTSGDRILLWFDLENADGGKKVSMGDETVMNNIPKFKVSAIGAFEQKPGCPEYSYNALSPERLEDLCRGECYNPSDIRKIITRIEVIRILPQISPDEDVSTLIQDPWKIIECPLDPDGCTVNFEDEEYQDKVVSVSEIIAMTKNLGTESKKLSVLNIKEAKVHAMASGIFNKNTERVLNETCKFANEVLYLDE